MFVEPGLRRPTNEGTAGCFGLLLVFLSIWFVFLPFTGLMVILARGWDNTPSWFKTMWIASIMIVGTLALFLVDSAFPNLHLMPIVQVVLKVVLDAIRSSNIYLLSRVTPPILTGVALAVLVVLRLLTMRANPDIRFGVQAAGMVFVIAFFISIGWLDPLVDTSKMPNASTVPCIIPLENNRTYTLESGKIQVFDTEQGRFAITCSNGVLAGASFQRK